MRLGILRTENIILIDFVDNDDLISMFSKMRFKFFQ